jgi:hypothetical protein
MPVLSRRADAFQRALDGERSTDAQLTGLLATSRQLLELGPGPGADPAFVARLHERLMAEAATMPTPSPAAAKASAARRAAAGPTPVVVVVGHGLPRALAGALASALLVGGVVGVVSRSSVPGDSLYPVKSWLDSVAVRLADSDFTRGQTYLTQAQEHISDARDLAGRHSDVTGDVNVALRQAIDSVRNGQRALDRSYVATNDPQALLAMRDFTARALPQVEAMRTEVPAGSLKTLGELEALLHESQQATGRRLAACGPRCETITGTAYDPAAVPGLPSTREPGRPASGVSRATLTVPSTAITGGAGGGASLPGVSAPSAGGVSVGGTGGATLSTGGAVVRVPSLSATLPLVSSTVQLPAPSVSLGTGGIGITVPSSTLLSATLPGMTISLPGLPHLP